MIVGVAGKKGSGKDTVGQYLVDQYGFQRVGFADLLKKSVAALFEVNVAFIEGSKNDLSTTVEIRSEFGTVRSLTLREFLQRYGTEAHRDIFDDDFWINQVFGFINHYDDDFVITDVRFPNEAHRVLNEGGKIWLVERPGLDSSDTHASEQDLTNFANEIIINDGSIQELKEKVDHILKGRIKSPVEDLKYRIRG